MPAYPEHVRSPGQTGSRRGPAKPTRMTLDGHRLARFPEGERSPME
jgi:hypothetical protein